MLWPIKKIKIFTENSNNKEILKFEDQKNDLFSILQNQKIFSIIKKKSFLIIIFIPVKIRVNETK